MEYTAEELLKGLRCLLGYVQNGSATTVKILQDDATRDYILVVGPRTYYGNSLREVLSDAIDNTSESE